MDYNCIYYDINNNIYMLLYNIYNNILQYLYYEYILYICIISVYSYIMWQIMLYTQNMINIIIIVT